MNDQLKNLLKKTLEISDKDFNENLEMEDVSGWDSLKHMALITELEKEFEIELEMEEIVSMISLPMIYKVLKTKGANVG